MWITTVRFNIEGETLIVFEIRLINFSSYEKFLYRNYNHLMVFEPVLLCTLNIKKATSFEVAFRSP